MRDTTILGISAFFHDSAACIVRNGHIAAAVQEERLTRMKNDRRFPSAALATCLEVAEMDADAVNHVAFFEKPHRKLERVAATARHYYPRGEARFEQAARRWSLELAQLPRRIRRELTRISPSEGRESRWDGRVIYSSHHESHAAAAFLPSPFDEAAIVTIDGLGEWATTTVAVGHSDHRLVPRIRILEEIRFPHSLGLLYSTITAFLGFAVNSDEYKVMGLAPYGKPRFEDTMREEVIDLRPDGSFALNMEMFSFGHGPTMHSERLVELFGIKPRLRSEPVEAVHADIAASLQNVLEEGVLGVARRAKETTELRRLCLAGGVALNSVANGKLLRSGLFDEIWIQPAAGDAGCCIGAALFAHHEVLGERRPRDRPLGRDRMEGALLGPRFSAASIQKALRRSPLPYRRLEEETVVEKAADLLASGAIVAWFQGRLEFGPRALGGRSILADPRHPETKDRLNAQVKMREEFRPFAPAVALERASEWFDLAVPSPYMLLVAPSLSSALPAATHVDGSARIQTVDRSTSPRLAALLDAFAARTGVPILVNTSFNLRDEPIVCSPLDALDCFARTEIDVLFLEDFLVTRGEP